MIEKNIFMSTACWDSAFVQQFCQVNMTYGPLSHTHNFLVVHLNLSDTATPGYLELSQVSQIPVPLLSHTFFQQSASFCPRCEEKAFFLKCILYTIK